MSDSSSNVAVNVPVERANWQMAYNSKADAKDSIIISFTSPAGIKYGRQYDVDPQVEGLYNCFGCLSVKRIKTNAQFRNGQLFMTSFHDCASILYDTIESQQAEREAKFRSCRRPSSSASSSSSRGNKEKTSSRKNTGETSGSSKGQTTPVTRTPLKERNGDVAGSSKSKTPSTRAPSRTTRTPLKERNGDVAGSSKHKTPSTRAPSRTTRTPLKEKNGDVAGSSKRPTPTTRAPSGTKNEDAPPGNTQSDSPIAITPEQRTHLIHTIGDTPEKTATPSFGQPQITKYFNAAAAGSSPRTETSVNGNGRSSKEPPHTLASKNKANEKLSNKESPDAQPESPPSAMNQSAELQDEILIDDDSKEILAAKKSEKEPKNVPIVTRYIDGDITIVESDNRKPEDIDDGAKGEKNAETPPHLLQQSPMNQGSHVKKSYKEPKNVKIQKKQIDEDIILVGAEDADFDDGLVELDVQDPSNHLPSEKKDQNDDEIELVNSPNFLKIKENIPFLDEQIEIIGVKSEPSSSTPLPTAKKSKVTITPANINNLPKFREVDPSNFEYGMNEIGEKKRRLAVHESDNRSLIREYFGDPENDQIFRCCNCQIGIAKKKNDNFLVSLKHDCLPTLYAKFKETDDLYRSNFKKAERLSRSFNNASRNENQIPESKAQNESNLSSSSSSTNSDASSYLHQISRDDWEYGYDQRGNEKKRIIVFEPDNKEFAREYRNSGRNMICLGCIKKPLYASRTDGADPVVSIPPQNAHVCEPRSLEEIRRQQDVNRGKAQKRRKSVAEKEKMSDSENEKPAKRTRRNAAQESVQKNQSILNDSESDDPSQNMEDFNTSDATASNSFGQQDAHDIPSSINNNNPIHHDEPMTETLSHQPTPPSDSGKSTPAAQPHSDFHVPLDPNLPFSHRYFHPCSAFPERSCAKLNLEYSAAKTLLYWTQIGISEFNHNSIPSKTLSLNNIKYSGPAAISCFLTGSENFAMEIKDFVNVYAYKNAIAIGQCLGMNLSRSEVVLDMLQSFNYVHFVVMAQMLECRFAVYENGKWMRYGSWTDEFLPLYILELKDGKYSPVLSFE